MPKMEAASITQKISLSQIIDTGNIREREKYGPNEKGEYPEEIRQLAQSIKTTGQIQPVVVKLAGEVDGVKQYELIAGFRRRAAFEFLCKNGDDFSMINASIITGDKLIIQLVENIQREDLSAAERERAIFHLAENGLKQTEIAGQLSKSKSYVSIHLSAYKIRLFAEKAGIDLSGVETSTLGELLSIPETILAVILDELVHKGGTRREAKLLAETFKRKEAPPPEVSPAEPESPAPADTPEPPPATGGNLDPLADIPPEPPAAPPDEKQEPQTKPERKPLLGGKDKPEPTEADHRIIDVNDILTVIYDYMKKADEAEKETCKTLLALIHQRLDRA